MPTPFIFWQNIISPHQAPFLRSLAGMGHEVTVVAPEIMTADRLALGWQAPDLGLAKVIIAPDGNAIRKIVQNGSSETIHVLAGARWTPLGRQATEWCLKSDCRMGVMSEAPDPRGLAGCARRLKYVVERFTHGRHYDFILAMGEMGVRWFHQCGYASSRLFPFAYVTGQESVVSRPPSARRSQVSGLAPAEDCQLPTANCPPLSALPAGAASLLFVGQWVPRKGVDLLLRAFALVKSPGIKLQLVGDGLEEARLRGLAETLGISNSVEWLGRKNSAEIPGLMADSDVVVLPSHHDGWGAVVNESLMAGTPVICSTACGAADLIRQPPLGTVFPAGNVQELARALQSWSSLGRRTLLERQRIRSWSGCIEGARLADYFVSVMSHVYQATPRPIAPWRA